MTVLVSAFGFQQTVEESFSLPLVIEPGEGGGGPTSFNLSATQGCSPLTVQGENLILDAGATYAWDFGNGQTSTGLNPTFVYDTPGTYTVSVVTEVTELALTQVNITTGGGWGQDIEDFWLTCPTSFERSKWRHLHLCLRNGKDPHARRFHIPLDAGTTYNIAFYDSDGVITGDDFLGSSDFTPTGGGDLTVSNSTTAILTLTETIVASFNESTQVVVFDGLDVYQDLDGDGFGNPNVPVDACNPDNTEPYAFNDQDCNDGDATIYFDAPGTGENVDNNCDGVITGAEVTIVEGCTDAVACNFDSEATLDDGSCEFAQKDLIAKATAWQEKIAKELAEEVLRSTNAGFAVEMEPHASAAPTLLPQTMTPRRRLMMAPVKRQLVWETSTSMASSAWPTS